MDFSRKTKSSTVFICIQCGYESSKWMGKCPSCGEWNSFNEEAVSISHPSKGSKTPTSNITPVALNVLDPNEIKRFYTGIGEFDRVLGGLVEGQCVLLSGQPGIGKSTLLLQLAGVWKEHGRVLYVNGEESNNQVKVRASRLGLVEAHIKLVPEVHLEPLLGLIRKERPALLIVDSVQTLISEQFQSVPGSVVQVRETAHALVSLAKELGIPLILVAHINKDGNIAGPKILEHVVDTVLYLESDSKGTYRILRSLKNRFFSTDESGFFKMQKGGLYGQEDLSEAFRFVHEDRVSGVVIFPFLEGQRVIPVEIQALCSPTQFNYPRRAADGMDQTRLLMLIAILERRLKIRLSDLDIYVNITNGLTIDDPALDLAVILSVWSSLKDRSIPQEWVFAGEVGLTGEVRPIAGMEKRISECERLKFQRLFCPTSKSLKGKTELKLFPIKNIEEALTLSE